jgi:hypothetical protein
VNNDIARINDDPVACRSAFNDGPDAFLAERIAQFIRRCGYLPGRGPGCDDHIVGNGGLALQVDGNDIFDFIFVESLQDKIMQFVLDFVFGFRRFLWLRCDGNLLLNYKNASPHHAACAFEQYWTVFIVIQ